MWDMVHVTKLSKIILLQRVEVKRIYIYDRPVQVPNHFWKLIGTYLLLSKIYILCMDSLAWSSAFLIFWSECQNLTKLSYIPQMALSNSDNIVRISASFVRNNFEIWSEFLTFWSRSYSQNVRNVPDQAK